MAAFNRIHEHYQRALRHHLVQDRVHPLDKYNDVELIKRYRFNREGINYITELLINDIAPKGNTNNPIPPVDRICAALQFYASGCFQRTDGDTLHVSQSSVSRIVTTVSEALTRKLHQFIHLPCEERRRNTKLFYCTARFPGITGVINCTHVKIQAPSEYEDQYVNRKRFHSINVQVVFDANCYITNMDAEWPVGSSNLEKKKNCLRNGFCR